MANTANEPWLFAISRRALALASDPGHFLSMVQIGITLVGVLSCALSGATLGLRLTAWLVDAGLPQGAGDAIGVGVVVTLIIYAFLIASRQWPDLKVCISCTKVEGYLDGKLYLAHTLSETVSSRIGLWSKADSYMHFSDLQSNELFQQKDRDEKTVGRVPVVRRARSARLRRWIRDHHPAGIFVRAWLRSISNRNCSKRSPSWNRRRDARDWISRSW